MALFHKDAREQDRQRMAASMTWESVAVRKSRCGVGLKILSEAGP